MNTNQNKTRIAIYTQNFPPRGGGISAVHFNIFYLLKSNYDVKLFAFDEAGEGCDDIVKRKTPTILDLFIRWLTNFYVRRHDKTGFIQSTTQIFSAFPAVLALNKKLKVFNPHVIIVPDFSLPLLMLKKGKTSKVVWMARHNYQRFQGQPLIGNRSWFDTFLAGRLEKRAVKKADIVVSPSAYMEKVFRETLSKDIEVRVIPNFIRKGTVRKVPVVDIRKKHLKRSADRLIYVPSGGTLAKGRRHIYEIIRRIGKTGRAAFYISGPIEDGLKEELQFLSERINVFAPGPVSYLENLSNVKNCDFAVSPTLVENLSNALIEALSFGLPCVTFDTGGNREIVDNNFNGFVVPRLDVDGLIECANLLVMDDELFNEMKQNASKSVRSKFEESEILSQYIKLIQDLSFENAL